MFLRPILTHHFRLHLFTNRKFFLHSDVRASCEYTNVVSIIVLMIKKLDEDVDIIGRPN